MNVYLTMFILSFSVPNLCLDMSLLFEINLTPKEINKLNCKLRRHTHHQVAHPHCHKWNGEINDSGYGIIRMTVRGKRYKVTVHRLIYFLSQQCRPLDKNIHVSHLCHNNLCLNILHLSYENGEINHRRTRCRNLKTCQGHGRYLPRCIF
jgi:hypothetical protein